MGNNKDTNAKINVNCGAIILAAGEGSRFHGQKQFVNFLGRPMWENVYMKAVRLIPTDRIVVVGVDIEGGSTRTKSVIKGLEELGNREEKIARVLILEAARPLVTIRQMQEIMECTHASCTYVQPLVNTVIGKNGTYMNRNDYFEMTTPNAMDYEMLRTAFSSGKYSDLTDDTRVMKEHFGIKPHFHQGSDNLLKVTYPKDIYTLEKIAEEIEDEENLFCTTCEAEQ